MAHLFMLTNAIGQMQWPADNCNGPLEWKKLFMAFFSYGFGWHYARSDQLPLLGSLYTNCSDWDNELKT
jgi:hypothetical protein